jgi:hypothetical protein
MKTPIWCRTHTGQVGDACREVVESLLEVGALYRLRAAQGIPLRKKYGETRLEAACVTAIAVGEPPRRTIKGILIAGTTPASRNTLREPPSPSAVTTTPPSATSHPPVVHAPAPSGDGAEPSFMGEELFGPILPIVPVASADAAIG